MSGMTNHVTPAKAGAAGFWAPARDNNSAAPAFAGVTEI